MSPEPAGSFDPGPDVDRRHLLLENSAGHRSLWPAWRAVPSGWTPRFGPAPHGRCVHRAMGAGSDPQARLSGPGVPPGRPPVPYASRGSRDRR
ncbi:MbtH family NRPS accessory protein [Streptomyces sp. NPDC044989]|uniref:MbtH family NRPS accessory protein n=1 Tax=Streptomyces sp. NPDC044989 TaxID=3154336 RepID=UPI0033E41CA4